MTPRTPSSPHPRFAGPVRGALLRGVMAPIAVLAAAATSSATLPAQTIDDRARLNGVETVAVRVESVWDEAITMEAGGATPEQFREALRMTFRDRLVGAADGPTVDGSAAAAVACHVDTFYDAGLIVYALRVQTEEPGEDGRPVITWIKSWVGSFSVQQLHLMFRLGEQCAESFLEDWQAVN